MYEYIARSYYAMTSDIRLIMHYYSSSFYNDDILSIL